MSRSRLIRKSSRAQYQLGLPLSAARHLPLAFLQEHWPIRLHLRIPHTCSAILPSTGSPAIPT